MTQILNNYTYIDAANLHNGILGFGWRLDYARFRVWLTEKYKDKCSILLKRTDASITYLNDVRSFFEWEKEKAPDANETA